MNQKNKDVRPDKIITPLNLKDKFIKRYSFLLGDDYEEFVKFSSTYSKKSIRINTLKKEFMLIKKSLEKNWNLKKIPWSKDGFWIKHKKQERYDVGNTPEHQLGYIYVQDAASMIPPIVLDPKEGDVVLDLCAAPGSKTTQIAQYMKNEGIIVANDSQGKRLSALGINLQRCGARNVLITKMDGEKIKGEAVFDKILLDAPCSGTGTIRKSYKIAEMWSPHLVARMAKAQKKLIKNAFKLLKKGGILVYSTCTLEPEENEEIIHSLLQDNSNAKIEEIILNINRTKPILEFEGKKYSKEINKCLRIHPQDNDSEGFFIAKITKI